MPITTEPKAGRPVDSNGQFTSGLFDCCGDGTSCIKDCYQNNILMISKSNILLPIDYNYFNILSSRDIYSGSKVS